MGVCVIVGATAYMGYIGVATSWQYYLTVDECVASAATLGADRIRVSGRIVPQSLQITADRRQATFSLEGRHRQLSVVCPGPLPDGLVDGLSVVVEGRLDESGCLRGEKIVTRCASKYESRPGDATSQPTDRAGKDGPG